MTHRAFGWIWGPLADEQRGAECGGGNSPGHSEDSGLGNTDT